MKDSSNEFTWRKSRRSGSGGEACVEVASWRKSSRSNNGGACVEVASWRKSSRSNNGGNCVEVGVCGCCGTAVRDSKDPDGPKLAFGVAAWRAFHADVVAGHYDLT